MPAGLSLAAGLPLDNIPMDISSTSCVRSSAREERPSHRAHQAKCKLRPCAVAWDSCELGRELFLGKMALGSKGKLFLFPVCFCRMPGTPVARVSCALSVQKPWKCWGQPTACSASSLGGFGVCASTPWWFGLMHLMHNKDKSCLFTCVLSLSPASC